MNSVFGMTDNSGIKKMPQLALQEVQTGKPMKLTKRQFLNIATGLVVAGTLIGQSVPPTAPELEARPYGVYYQTATGGWQKLESIAKSSIGAKMKFMGASSAFIHADAESPVRLDNHRPVFGLRTTGDPMAAMPGWGARDLQIVSMLKKKDHREIAASRFSVFGSNTVGSDAKNTMQVTLTEVGEQTYILTLKADLPPGEYMLTLRGTAGSSGYDFGVK